MNKTAEKLTFYLLHLRLYDIILLNEKNRHEMGNI